MCVAEKLIVSTWYRPNKLYHVDPTVVIYIYIVDYLQMFFHKNSAQFHSDVLDTVNSLLVSLKIEYLPQVFGDKCWRVMFYRVRIF